MAALVWSSSSPLPLKRNLAYLGQPRVLTGCLGILGLPFYTAGYQR
jgi:hypothetical protein